MTYPNTTLKNPLRILTQPWPHKPSHILTQPSQTLADPHTLLT